ncbi:MULTISPECIES: ABC transporter permease [unclassified Blastococcus]
MTAPTDRTAPPAVPDVTAAPALPDPVVDLGPPASPSPAGAGETAVRRHRVPRGRSALLGLAGCAALVLGWALISAAGVVSEQSLPGPVAVARALGELAVDPDFLTQVGDTVLAWLVALLLATVVAVPLGLLIGSVPFLQPPTAGVVHALRSIPATALIPVAILAFGIGFQMKVFLTVFAIVLPILLNALYGVRSVDPVMRRVARSLRWSWARTARRLVLPAALPSIASGIRVAGGIGLIVTVSTELLGARSGLGTVIRTYQQSELPAQVYASIVVAGVLGIVLGSLLRFAERRLLPWAPSQRSGR